MSTAQLRLFCCFPMRFRGFRMLSRKPVDKAVFSLWLLPESGS